MLTSYQVQHIGFADPWGEFWCIECTNNRLAEGGGGDVEGFEPVSRFELDEVQSQWDSYHPWDGYDDEDENHVENCECLLPVECSACGTELVEGYNDSNCETEPRERYMWEYKENG